MMYASLFTTKGKDLAFAAAKLERCRLSRSATGDCIWVGHAAFDLTQGEGARLATAFGLQWADAVQPGAPS